MGSDVFVNVNNLTADAAVALGRIRKYVNWLERFRDAVIEKFGEDEYEQLCNEVENA